MENPGAKMAAASLMKAATEVLQVPPKVAVTAMLYLHRFQSAAVHQHDSCQVRVYLAVFPASPEYPQGSCYVYPMWTRTGLHLQLAFLLLHHLFMDAALMQPVRVPPASYYYCTAV